MDDIQQTARDARILIEEIKRRALICLMEHPGYNAAQIARVIGYHNSQRVLNVLKDAEREGKCRSRRETKDGYRVLGPYLWFPS